MADQDNYSKTLQNLILKKTEWYNEKELPRMLEKYRLLYSCVNNLYELLVQKSIISTDPYRLDKKISEITSPDDSPFADAEKNLVIGTRFSDYESMLDFLCTYTRFTVENITLPTIKKLQDLNTCFNWEDLSTNSTKPNTRGLALILNEARTNAPVMVQSMINDHSSKCSQATMEINQMLNQMIRFQRELYKVTVRKDLLEHPSFNHEKGDTSGDAELAEIKRLFSDAMGKKPFYTELINEIIAEDHSPNKEKLRAEVLAKLQIKDSSVKTAKKTVDYKEILMNSVTILGALAPTYQTLYSKISDNFELLHFVPSTPFQKFISALKKALNIKPKEIQIHISAIDPVTKTKSSREIKIHSLLNDMLKKERIYSGIATRGPEYQKIFNAEDEQILSFMGKQISENQNLFNTIYALDDYFKNEVSQTNKSKVKGMKIELDTLKSTIINANKKRSEYQSMVEEAEQMKKLGIEN